jgi:hypothetical protein
VVDQLAQEYAGQNVIFIEDNVDAPHGTLYSHWWEGATGSVGLPLSMVENGYLFANGYEDFHTHFKQMVDSALALPAEAQMSATWSIVNGAAQVEVTVLNNSGANLSAANEAHLHLLVYADEAPGEGNGTPHLTHRFVVATGDYPLTLAGGAQVTLTNTLPAVSGRAWETVNILAMVDYLPVGSSTHHNLQAAIATRGALTVTETGLSLVAAPGVGSYNLPLHILAPAGLAWTTSVQLGAGVNAPKAAWLQVTPSSGTGSADLSVQVLTPQLAKGTNTAAIVVSSPTSQFSPISIPVSVMLAELHPVYLPVMRK